MPPRYRPCGAAARPHGASSMCRISPVDEPGTRALRQAYRVRICSLLETRSTRLARTKVVKPPEVGTAAPDFTLPSVSVVAGIARRDDQRLSAEHGHPVVLAFYPGDDTPVCTKQMCAYTSEMTQFTDLDAVVWGISPQDL